MREREIFFLSTLDHLVPVIDSLNINNELHFAVIIRAKVK